ncbi:MAG: sugar phosphate nucleotidyltransferase [Planctomycetota bacterium]|nr:sugar phosphate nucleotidyltransferase [Planctomycetota bacterium]
MHAIIMAGGSGTRFWPASRKSRPKQFLPLDHGRALVQSTVERVKGLTGSDRTWIVTNPGQVDGMLEALDGFPRDQVIVEPEARDTAPCVALAAAAIEARDPGATMAVMPADHLINPVDAFHGVLNQGAELAADNETLVTFGIPPSYAATSFGYIELGNQHPSMHTAYEVLQFREKPDQTTAHTFLNSDQFLWNSGIFVWNFASLTNAMGSANPDLLAATNTMLAASKAGDEAALNQAFCRCPKTSVDYAVMEKAERVVVIRADFNWNDLGSFAALGAIIEADSYDNIILNETLNAAVLHQSERCTVYSEGPQTVALFGVQDIVVVNTGDALLVVPRDRCEDIKEMIQHLKRSNRQDLL